MIRYRCGGGVVGVGEGEASSRGGGLVLGGALRPGRGEGGGLSRVFMPT